MTFTLLRLKRLKAIYFPIVEARLAEVDVVLGIGQIASGEARLELGLSFPSVPGNWLYYVAHASLVGRDCASLPGDQDGLRVNRGTARRTTER